MLSRHESSKCIFLRLKDAMEVTNLKEVNNDWVSVFSLCLSQGLRVDNYATDTRQDQSELAPTGTHMAL